MQYFWADGLINKAAASILAFVKVCKVRMAANRNLAWDAAVVRSQAGQIHQRGEGGESEDEAARREALSACEFSRKCRQVRGKF